MSYRQHIKSSVLLLKPFEIIEENRLQDTFIEYFAYQIPDKTSQFLITRETIEKSAESIARIEALIKAKDLKLIFAKEIFLEQVNSMLLLYTISPISHFSLSDVVNTLTPSQKLRIFQNLSQCISSIHDLGVPYLELSPESILIENKSIVYLKPFRISPEVYAEDFYYASPEVLSGIPYFLTQPAGDIWSLGCIYAELFISLTPLFQGPSPEEKLQRMFEVLGIPVFQDVEDFITWENYKEIKALAKQNSENSSLFSGLEDFEENILRAMLTFAVEKRIDARGVTCFPWQNESVKEIVSENKSVQSKYSIFDKKIENFPNEPRSDNTLTVAIISAINLELFKYCQDEYFLSFGYEIEVGNEVVFSSTGLIKASGALQINFVKEFAINSENFKKKYRTSPILIKVSQSLMSGKGNCKKREDVLGVCEAYLGLLFSSSGGNQNSVQGWYHIMSGKGVIGQLQLEIKTKTPISQVETVKRTQSYVDVPYADRSLIKEITQDMGNLTAQLKERNEGKVKRDHE